jgi:hypothetical protein
MQNWFRRRFLFWLLPAVLLFAQQAAMAHLVSHLGDNAAGNSKTLAHQKLCDGCLAVEKLLHIPGVKEHRVIVLHGEDVPEPVLLSGLVSLDAGTPSCRDPPKYL